MSGRGGGHRGGAREDDDDDDEVLLSAANVGGFLGFLAFVACASALGIAVEAHTSLVARLAENELATSVSWPQYLALYGSAVGVVAAPLAGWVLLFKRYECGCCTKTCKERLDDCDDCLMSGPKNKRKRKVPPRPKSPWVKVSTLTFFDGLLACIIVVFVAGAIDSWADSSWAPNSEPLLRERWTQLLASQNGFKLLQEAQVTHECCGWDTDGNTLAAQPCQAPGGDTSKRLPGCKDSILEEHSQMLVKVGLSMASAALLLSLLLGVAAHTTSRELKILSKST